MCEKMFDCKYECNNNKILLKNCKCIFYVCTVYDFMFCALEYVYCSLTKQSKRCKMCLLVVQLNVSWNPFEFMMIVVHFYFWQLNKAVLTQKTDSM